MIFSQLNNALNIYVKAISHTDIQAYGSYQNYCHYCSDRARNSLLSSCFCVLLFLLSNFSEAKSHVEVVAGRDEERAESTAYSTTDFSRQWAKNRSQAWLGAPVRSSTSSAWPSVPAGNAAAQCCEWHCLTLWGAAGPQHHSHLSTGFELNSTTRVS